MPTPYPKNVNTGAKRAIFDSLRTNLHGVKDTSGVVSAIADTLQVEEDGLRRIVQDRLVKIGVGWGINLGTLRNPNKVKVLNFIAVTCASKSGQEALDALDQAIRDIRNDTSAQVVSAMSTVHRTDRRWTGKRNFKR